MKRLIFDESDLIERKRKAKISYIKNIEIASCYPKKNEFVYIINSKNLHNFDYIKQDTIYVLEKYFKLVLKKYLGSNKTIMFVGLGNDRLSADSLGKLVVDNIFLSRGLEMKKIKTTKTCAICPDIYCKTGIQTFDIVASIVNQIKPNLVIIIDSLATKSLSRLSVSFQITNTSLIPGGAMGSDNKEFSSKSLNCPCVIIGVPFILQITDKEQTIHLTPKDIEINVKRCANIISTALNNIVHKDITKKEMEILLSN